MGGEIPEEEQGMRDPSMHKEDDAEEIVPASTQEMPAENAGDAALSPAAPLAYDGSEKRINWPGKEDWGPDDLANKRSDAQIAGDIAFKYLVAKESPNNPQVAKATPQIMENYEKAIGMGGEAAELVTRCVTALERARKNGDRRGYAALYRDLTDERGALKE